MSWSYGRHGRRGCGDDRNRRDDSWSATATATATGRRDNTDASSIARLTCWARVKRRDNTDALSVARLAFWTCASYLILDRAFEWVRTGKNVGFISVSIAAAAASTDYNLGRFKRAVGILSCCGGCGGLHRRYRCRIPIFLLLSCGCLRCVYFGPVGRGCYSGGWRRLSRGYDGGGRRRLSWGYDGGGRRRLVRTTSRDVSTNTGDSDWDHHVGAGILSCGCFCSVIRYLLRSPRVERPHVVSGFGSCTGCGCGCGSFRCSCRIGESGSSEDQPSGKVDGKGGNGDIAVPRAKDARSDIRDDVADTSLWISDDLTDSAYGRVYRVNGVADGDCRWPPLFKHLRNVLLHLLI